MSHGKGDKLVVSLSSHLMLASQPEEFRDLAAQALQAMDSRGELQPVDGWDPAEGTVLDAYLNILGLDDAPIRDSFYAKRSKAMRIPIQ